MAQPNYWFAPTEYHARVARVQAELRAKGLDALIAFQPESVTYLTGFFTRAYSSFQFAIIPANGAPTMFCRDVEEYYLDSTCVYPDRALWNDSQDTTAVAADIIRARLGATARVGAELGSWTVSVARYEKLTSLLPGIVWTNEQALVERGLQQGLLAGGEVLHAGLRWKPDPEPAPLPAPSAPLPRQWPLAWPSRLLRGSVASSSTAPAASGAPDPARP
jgi:hypothetical protein